MSSYQLCDCPVTLAIQRLEPVRSAATGPAEESAGDDSGDRRLSEHPPPGLPIPSGHRAVSRQGPAVLRWLTTTSAPLVRRAESGGASDGRWWLEACSPGYRRDGHAGRAGRSLEGGRSRRDFSRAAERRRRPLSWPVGRVWSEVHDQGHRWHPSRRYAIGARTFTISQSVDIAKLLVRSGVDTIECGHPLIGRTESERVAAMV